MPLPGWLEEEPWPMPVLEPPNFEPYAKAALLFDPDWETCPPVLCPTFESLCEKSCFLWPSAPELFDSEELLTLFGYIWF